MQSAGSLIISAPGKIIRSLPVKMKSLAVTDQVLSPADLSCLVALV